MRNCNTYDFQRLLKGETRNFQISWSAFGNHEKVKSVPVIWCKVHKRYKRPQMISVEAFELMLLNHYNLVSAWYYKIQWRKHQRKYLKSLTLIPFHKKRINLLPLSLQYELQTFQLGELLKRPKVLMPCKSRLRISSNDQESQSPLNKLQHIERNMSFVGLLAYKQKWQWRAAVHFVLYFVARKNTLKTIEFCHEKCSQDRK